MGADIRGKEVRERDRGREIEGERERERERGGGGMDHQKSERKETTGG